MNRRYRQMKGYEGLLPNKEERLLCLRNNKKLNLTNGLQGVMTEEYEDDGEYLMIKFRPEDSKAAVWIKIHKAHFQSYNDPQILKDLSYWDLQKANEFDFGYVITGHKSQGSQWDDVMIYNDGFGFSDKLLKKRWLYTVITRAVERLTLIQAEG